MVSRVQLIDYFHNESSDRFFNLAGSRRCVLRIEGRNKFFSVSGKEPIYRVTGAVRDQNEYLGMRKSAVKIILSRLVWDVQRSLNVCRFFRSACFSKSSSKIPIDAHIFAKWLLTPLDVCVRFYTFVRPSIANFIVLSRLKQTLAGIII